MDFYLFMGMKLSSGRTVRLFVALPVSAAVKEELRCLQTELQERLPGDWVRWTRPEQLHLTLRFLGEVEAGRVESLIEAVRGVCNRFAPLRLRAERMGVFPHARSPRVIWVSVHDERGELPLLQSAVSEAAGSFTRQEEDKGFMGHLTIGRVKNIKSGAARVLAESVEGLRNRVFGEWTVDQVEIVQSELASGGSRYSCVASIPLLGTA
ncbi:MAG: uncharacterized protein JWR69_3886 [Pedosphaera sp.]|nr:uncharacterized protein [Pedosphaera sp.]